MRHYMVVFVQLMMAMALVACAQNEPDEKDITDEAVSVSIIQVQPVTLPVTAETVALMEGAKETEIRPRVGGIIKRRLYTEGAFVEAGQPLFQIDPIPFENTLAELRAQLYEQQVRVERMRREEHRMKQLVAEDFVSERMYDSAFANLAIEKAALETTKVRVQRAKLNLSYTTVTAPVAGVTGRSQFSEGSLVMANDSLLTTVAQLSPIWVRFSFSDNEMSRFGGRMTEKNVQYVSVILPDGSEYEQKGEINFAASQIDPLLGTQQLRATFENINQRLLPGQFVRVRVAAIESQNVFVVPQLAVLTSDLGRYVYVVNDENKAIQHPVKVGEWVGTDWIILEGLNLGDKVIVDNIIRLKPG
ncbi:MAG: efflux RND transporter periplasmic adaptor subunit, partial [Nitrosomonas sp.]|nr:efflux RND transporter periplasmic adaptor subunit [Nitrosomonas sp.]